MQESGSPSIPSAVSVGRNGSVMCGSGAKMQIGSRAYKVFEGFKMLLAETDKSMIEGRGYDEKYTPRFITKCYLESILKAL